MSSSIFYAANQMHEQTDEEYVDAPNAVTYAATLRPYAPATMRRAFLRWFQNAAIAAPSGANADALRVYASMIHAQRTAAAAARHSDAPAASTKRIRSHRPKR